MAPGSAGPRPRRCGLYRGELMPALYDDWVMPERDRLHRSCLTLLDQLIALERDAGLFGQANERARRRIELEPLEEVGYRTLLQVQALSGDRAAALQTYHRCVSVLERELGVAPDQATTAEYERLIAVRSPGPAGARRSRCPRSARWHPSARSGWSAARPSSPCCSSAGRRRSPGRPVSPWSRARPASGRPGCWTSCARPRRGPAATSCGPAASRPGAGWRWPRCRSGCAARPCARPAVGLTRSGPVRWTVSSRRRTPTRWLRRGRWTTPGSGTGSSRAWPGRCCRPGARRCWCSTTCSGATRTRWPGCSCCCTSAGTTRCWSWRRPGWKRPSATPSSRRCCGCSARRARSST